MLSEKQTLMLISLSRSTLRRLVHSELFPPPVEIAPRRIAFFEDEIAKWQEARAKKRK
jgi:predicted DNA-binding transcriptional regulator AlpA